MFQIMRIILKLAMLLGAIFVLLEICVRNIFTEVLSLNIHLKEQINLFKGSSLGFRDTHECPQREE